MDAHQSYCLNFWLLARCWAIGPLAIGLAWALSVLGITLTAGCAWLLGAALAPTLEPVNFRQSSRFEFALSMIATILNYLRFFRFLAPVEAANARELETVKGKPVRVAVAIVSLLGSIAVILTLLLRVF